MAKDGGTTTQQFVEIEDVREGVVILRGGALRKILMVSGINFDLKSEAEQNLILQLFQNLLNSLNFSLQILVHSRKLNIEGYLARLATRQDQEQNELLRNQIGEYREFVRVLVQENAIMNKSYFVVVPYDPIHVPGSDGALRKGLFGFGKKKPAGEEEKRLEERFREHLEQLNQRVEQTVTNLHQLELRAVPLDQEEVIELFYNLYNPEAIEKKELEIAKQE